jgi:hypothetical protein
MCLLCQSGLGTDGDLARRARVLQLLALVEHKDALPTDAALRLGREIVALIGPGSGSRRCDPAAPPK